jgi:hypothetical protein
MLYNATILFNNLNPQTSQLDPSIFIESYFWNHWREAVMAITYEGHYRTRITDGQYIHGEDYFELGLAHADGLLEYFDLPGRATSEAGRRTDWLKRASLEISACWREGGQLATILYAPSGDDGEHERYPVSPGSLRSPGAMHIDSLRESDRRALHSGVRNLGSAF